MKELSLEKMEKVEGGYFPRMCGTPRFGFYWAGLIGALMTVGECAIQRLSREMRFHGEADYIEPNLNMV